MASCAAPCSPSSLLRQGLLPLFLAVLLRSPPATANIQLVFPPARSSSDFLYSSPAQPGPCGGPRPAGGTRLQPGALLNVSWHNTHPEQGELMPPPPQDAQPAGSGSMCTAKNGGGTGGKSHNGQRDQCVESIEPGKTEHAHTQTTRK